MCIARPHLPWLFALASVNALASGFERDQLQIHGFASQAMVYTSDNQYFGDSTKTSFDFTELGLNASFQATSRVLLSSQVLVRRAGEMYDGTPALDYALADLTLTETARNRLGVRAGRFKNSLGLYNETRDVSFTRPGIFLPQVVYYDKVRNLMLSTDGLEFHGETSGDMGNLSLNIGGGMAVIDENVEWAYLGDDYNGELKADGPSWTTSLWYSSPAERLKLGLSGLTARMSFDAGAGSPLDSGSIDYLIWIASFQYNIEDWTLSAEYSRVPLEWNDFGPLYPFVKESIEGYYLQGAYRLRQDLEFTLRYEEGFADRGDRDGTHSSALTGGITPPFDFYSKIWTAGLRWDIKPNLMLRLEYQRHQGTFALSIRENADPEDLVKDWDALAASISVRF
jgi:hypothetical protein